MQTPYLTLPRHVFFHILSHRASGLSLPKEQTGTKRLLHGSAKTRKHKQTSTLTAKAVEGTFDSASVSGIGIPSVTADSISAEGGGHGLPVSTLRGRVPWAVHATLTQLLMAGSKV